MGNLRAVMSVGLLALAACSDSPAKPDAPMISLDAAVDAIPDSPPPIDAPNYDFTCLNNSAPANVAATVTVSGTAQEIVLNGTTPSIQANGGVAIKACTGDCMNANNLGTTTSAGTGAYSTAALTTGGTALDGFLDASKTGDRRTLVYPPSPLAQSQSNVPVLQFNSQAFGLLNQFLLTPMQNDAANGLIGIVVTDCAGTPMDGATVTVTQGGTAAGNAPYDLGALAMGMAPGTWLIANVPAGDATVNAMYGGMTFRAHVVKSVAGATTTTGVRPGF